MQSKVLTPLQTRVLLALFENGLGDRGYYLTGGTALAEFYLQHRYSDDLDIFTRKTDPHEEELKMVSDLLGTLGFEVSVRFINHENMLLFVDGLKVEFRPDVPAKMDSPLVSDRIVIDSFEDIAVNKICTILSRPQTDLKDFCDLFFILKESRYELGYLLNRASEKDKAFEEEEGQLFFAANLLAVEELQKLPRMIKPLSLEELREFFVPLAEQLIQSLRPQGG